MLSATAALAVAAVLAGPAGADSTPVGPLPKGPVTKVATARGSLVAVALPQQRASTGLVWRIARPLNSRVLRQVSEGEIGPNVVVVFRAVGAGRASVAFALTRGDASRKAVRALTYQVTAT
jgi:hypothetical protein